jgi:hypothetical protein
MELYTAACAGASCIIDNHPCYREARQDKPFSCVWATMKHKKRLAKNSSITSLGVMIMVLILTFAIITITVMPHIRNLSETIRKNTDIIVPGLDEEGMYNMIKSYVSEKQYKEALELSEEFVLKFPESKYIHKVVYIKLFILIETFEFEDAYFLLNTYIQDNIGDFNRRNVNNDFSSWVLDMVSIKNSGKLSFSKGDLIKKFKEVTSCSSHLKFPTLPHDYSFVKAESFYFGFYVAAKTFSNNCNNKDTMEEIMEIALEFIHNKIPPHQMLKDIKCDKESMPAEKDILLLFHKIKDICGTKNDVFLIKRYPLYLFYSSSTNKNIYGYGNLIYGYKVKNFQPYATMWNLSREMSEFKSKYRYYNPRLENYLSLKFPNIQRAGEHQDALPFFAVYGVLDSYKHMHSAFSSLNGTGEHCFGYKNEGEYLYNKFANLFRPAQYSDDSVSKTHMQASLRELQTSIKLFKQNCPNEFNKAKENFTNYYNSLNNIYKKLVSKDIEKVVLLDDGNIKREKLTPGEIKEYNFLIAPYYLQAAIILDSFYSVSLYRNSLKLFSEIKRDLCDSEVCNLISMFPIFDKLIHDENLKTNFYLDSSFVFRNSKKVDYKGYQDKPIFEELLYIFDGTNGLSLISFMNIMEKQIDEFSKSDFVEVYSCIDENYINGQCYDKFSEGIQKTCGDYGGLLTEVFPFRTEDNVYISNIKCMELITESNGFEYLVEDDFKICCKEGIISESSSEYPGEQTENDGQEQTMDICESIPDPSWGEDPSDIKYNVPDVQTKCFYKYQINNVDGGSGVPEFSTAQIYSCREYVDKGVLPNSLGYPCLKGIGAGGYLSKNGDYIYYAKVSVAEGNYVDYPYGIDGNKICCKLNAPSESERSIYD